MVSRPSLSATKANLHTYHISYSFCGFFLFCGGDMGVGVQGKTSGEVTQHTAPCFLGETLRNKGYEARF